MWPRGGSGAEGLDGAVVEELDDAAAACGCVVEGGVVGEGAVDAESQSLFDVGVGGWGGVAGEVGGGADDGFAEFHQEGLAEVHLWHADAHGAVVCGEVGGYLDKEHVGGEDDGGGTVAAEQEVGGLVGQGGGEHGGGGEDEHGFAVVAFFDGVDAFDGLGVGGVAAYAPDGVGGVEEGLAALQGRQGSCE